MTPEELDVIARACRDDSVVVNLCAALRTAWAERDALLCGQMDMAKSYYAMAAERDEARAERDEADARARDAAGCTHKIWEHNTKLMAERDALMADRDAAIDTAWRSKSLPDAVRPVTALEAVSLGLRAKSFFADKCNEALHREHGIKAERDSRPSPSDVAKVREALEHVVGLLESSRNAKSKGSNEYDGLFIRCELGDELTEALRLLEGKP